MNTGGGGGGGQGVAGSAMSVDEGATGPCQNRITVNYFSFYLFLYLLQLVYQRYSKGFLTCLWLLKQ